MIASTEVRASDRLQEPVPLRRREKASFTAVLVSMAFAYFPFVRV